MMQRKLFMAALTPLLAVAAAAQQPAVHYDMSLTADGQITELGTGKAYKVQSKLAPFTVAGLDGEALRFDGYSNYVVAALPADKVSTDALTLQVTLAAETYPMMKVDVAETTPTYATICGNLADKQGMALQLSSQGDLRFQFGSAYAGGFLFTIDGTQKLPRGCWATVTAVLDKAANAAKLYLDGVEIGTSRMSRSDIVHSSAPFYIGKDATEVKSGPFLINTFCGLIDDISITNAALQPTPASTATASAGQRPDFSYPLARYTSAAAQGGTGAKTALWRPRYHAMPSGSWTNETHGMLYSDGRWHVFFQKNANGPYMSRLHWGHISSENLYDWHDEPIAVAPGEAYDIKGCWSGSVYTDGDTPYLLYTAVDNARATIAQARATDATLADWQKEGIVVNGRPAGLSDDFRDPYFFEANGKKYIIVGTSKNGVGACTLHRFENGAWTNDGTLFFQGTLASQHGTFWEMPNITQLSPARDGHPARWLFTCTPLGTSVGVRTLCWVGTIGQDGKFQTDGNGMQYLEMGGISRDGYGLLSPTIYKAPSSDVYILLGIVPDKLPTQQNYDMGWAHNYSLPRELTLTDGGQIVQRPYSGLAAMRTSSTFAAQTTLLGTQSLAPVSGLQVELLGRFTVQQGTCGFNFMKWGDRQATLSYDAATGMLTLDVSKLDRTVNDGGVYKGVYTAALPKKVGAGEQLKLHVFVDGSIVDIFVNDTWAFSVRVFPNDAAQQEAEVFATAETTVSVEAWVLDPSRSATDGIGRVERTAAADGCCYDLQGRPLPAMPQHGLCIRNGKKYVR